jgi:crotonobetainyl-CoA:carnitine CoA-transferase CaiB-like acyl-CoA transferase
LCRAIGQDAWLQNPGFATVEARYGRIAEINAALERIFRTNTTAHWLQALRGNSVVCGPVCGYKEFLADAQVRQQGIFQYIAQSGLDPVPVPRVPGIPGAVSLQPAPRVGEHTVAVLAGLGLNVAEIDALIESGAVASAARTA